MINESTLANDMQLNTHAAKLSDSIYHYNLVSPQVQHLVLANESLISEHRIVKFHKDKGTT